ALILGTGVANSGGWGPALRLAERTGCAVWAAPYAARETFPEDHPQFAGFLPAWRDQIRTLLAPYDAILVAGAPVFTYHVEGSGPHWPEHAKLAALSDDPQHLASLPGGSGVLGNVAEGLAQLAERANERAYEGEPRRLLDPEPRMTAAYVLKRIAALRPPEPVVDVSAPTARVHDHASRP